MLHRSHRQVKVRKLGKSREGASENSVWDYIREKDKEAMAEGAFMDTFLGQLVTTITLGLSVLIILWEIYLNTLLDMQLHVRCAKGILIVPLLPLLRLLLRLYPRVYPTYNPLNPQIMTDESMEAVRA